MMRPNILGISLHRHVTRASTIPFAVRRLSEFMTIHGEDPQVQHDILLQFQSVFTSLETEDTSNRERGLSRTATEGYRPAKFRKC